MKKEDTQGKDIKIDKSKNASDKKYQINNEDNITIEALDKEQEIPDNQNEEEGILVETDDTKLIKNLTEQLSSAQDKLLRAIAESENTRYRMNKKVEECKSYSIVNFVKDLLPVVDNFSRALLNVPKSLDANSKVLIEGITMTRTSLLSVFKKYGIEQIEPLEGETFDYNNHHAISQVITDKCKEGSIVSTMQIGYKIKDRLIRPASVSVAKK